MLLSINLNNSNLASIICVKETLKLLSSPQDEFITGVADKPLARPTTRCRRTESIVSLERGVCSCAELQIFACYRG